jgi:hypothetical protein
VKRGLLIVVFGLLLLAPRAHAHEGPPYAIVVDRQVGPYVVSIWGDPDVGTGTFWITFETPDGAPLPEDLAVEVAVQPVTGRLAEVRHAAVRDDLRDQAQFKAEIPFDAEERWRVRVVVESSAGGGEISEEVEVTPPGLGRWDLLLYAFPFVAIGVLWLRAVVSKKGKRPRAGERPAERDA